jgi:hypothetical protein
LLLHHRFCHFQVVLSRGRCCIGRRFVRHLEIDRLADSEILIGRAHPIGPGRKCVVSFAHTPINCCSLVDPVGIDWTAEEAVQGAPSALHRVRHDDVFADERSTLGALDYSLLLQYRKLDRSQS